MLILLILGLLWYRSARVVYELDTHKRLRQADTRMDLWIAKSFVQELAAHKRNTACSGSNLVKTKNFLTIRVSLVVGGIAPKYWQDALSLLSSATLHTPFTGAAQGIPLGQHEPVQAVNAQIKLDIRVITDLAGS